MKNFDRRLDLSAKFLQMGQALMDEGDDEKDSGTSLLGTMLIFMGGLALDDNDIYKFSELVAMFSAKKTIDNLEFNNTPLLDMLNKAADKETYDGLIDRIEKVRKKNKGNSEEEENIDD